MLVSAAVCPHPPALVPDVSQGAAGMLAELRRTCIESVQALVGVDHDTLVCVAPGPGTMRWGADAGGTLHAFGVDVAFGGEALMLPPALTIAAYLLEQAGVVCADILQAIDVDASPDACRTVGAELAAASERVAMLVMGDAGAKRTKTSPGYFDPRAEEFDAEAVRALGQPDPGALLRIAPALSAELWVAGRPSWQVLAGALGSTVSPMRGVIRYDAAPLGVGYFVVQLMTDQAGHGETLGSWG